MSSRGEELVFLISQPRSGSTLLQHILAGHPDVLTFPEPWLMLHFAYMLKQQGRETDYNEKYRYLATQSFLQHAGIDRKTFLEALRAAPEKLYKAALSRSRKTIFLDKTPRYFHIIPELSEIFPRAKFVFLLRHPLAVLVSILEYNLGGDWCKFLRQIDRWHDIVTAPALITDGVRLLGDRGYVVHYEDYVRNPEPVLTHLCAHLGLSFDPAILSYKGNVNFQDSTFVDQKSVYKHDGPVEDYVDAWGSRVAEGDLACFAAAYLKLLDDDVMATYRLDSAKLEKTLMELCPLKARRIHLLSQLLRSSGRVSSCRDALSRELMCSRIKGGLLGAFRRLRRLAKNTFGNIRR